MSLTLSSLFSTSHFLLSSSRPSPVPAAGKGMWAPGMLAFGIVAPAECAAQPGYRHYSCSCGGWTETRSPACPVSEPLLKTLKPSGILWAHTCRGSFRTPATGVLVPRDRDSGEIAGLRLLGLPAWETQRHWPRWKKWISGTSRIGGAGSSTNDALSHEETRTRAALGSSRAIVRNSPYTRRLWCWRRLVE